MTTLIFGGAGFVGLNIAQSLVGAGEAVILFDRAPVPPAFLDALPGGAAVQTIEDDVTDPRAVAAAANGVDAMVHGAAITAGPERESRDPEAILAVNLGSVVPVMRAARDGAVRRVVILSSGSAYGPAAFDVDLVTEADCRPDPEALYSITKFASERVAARLGALWSLDVRAVRLSAVFGPWERATGVRDTLSPQFQVMQAFSRGDPATFEREGVRDWVYAPDVGRAVAALLAAEAGALNHPLYHIGPGESWTALDWAQRVAAELGSVEARLTRPGEAATIDLHSPRDRSTLAVERMRADLGEPRYPDAASTARHYAQWWSRFGTGMGA